jgi:uncharacterized protein RhaS with RHS repeats
VTSISGGSISTTFTYGADGNQTSGLGRSLVYTSYNKPSSITQGARTISSLDDTEHQRFKQVTPEGTTLYISGFGVLAELNNPGATSAKWTDYLSVGNVKVGMRVNASGTLTLLYFKTDHLGSISVLTSGGGAAVQTRPMTPGASGAIRTAPTIPPIASPARPRAVSPVRRSSRLPASFN